MWVAVAVSVIAVSSVYTAVEAKKAKDDAEEQAEEDRIRALEAAEFAETEGEGVGLMGKVNLSIDETLDDKLSASGKSNLRI